MDFPYEKLPATWREPIRAYLEDGVRPNDDVAAVLANDLLRTLCAVDRDAVDLQELRTVAQWLYHEAPATALGSAWAIGEWCKAGGYRGHKIPGRPPRPAYRMVGAARVR